MLIFEGKGLRCRSLFGKWNDQDSEDAYSAGVLILVAKSARNFTRRKSPTLKPRQPRAVERDVWEIDGSGTHWCKAFLVGTSCVCVYIYIHMYMCTCICTCTCSCICTVYVGGVRFTEPHLLIGVDSRFKWYQPPRSKMRDLWPNWRCGGSKGRAPKDISLTRS